MITEADISENTFLNIMQNYVSLSHEIKMDNPQLDQVLPVSVKRIIVLMWDNLTLTEVETTSKNTL